jgi:son of sevenless-like protein
MFLTDLVFIEDGNKNYTKNGLINFTKKIILSKILFQIKSFQHQKYYYNTIPDLYNYLKDFNNNLNEIIEDEDILFEKSILLEPRE